MEFKQWMSDGIINDGNLIRFQRVMRKAEAKQPLTIGFLGGSITMGSLSSSPRSCYAYLVYEWWRKKFMNPSITYRNAGIGATTSQFAVARADSDLLDQNPDVVFLDFTVNDEANEKYQETFEGLVRKILSKENEPAVMIINNVRYDTGESAEEIHDEIGLHYDLPIASMGDSIYAQIKKGTINAADITSDYLHPNDQGHELVAGVIITLLEHIYQEVIYNPFLEAYRLPKPFTKNRFMNARRYDNHSLAYQEHGFHKDTKEQNDITDVFKNGWRAFHAGDSIQFQVPGSCISIQYKKTVHHPAPIAKVVVDEETEAILDANFDESWGDCLYLQDIVLHTQAKLHKVVITLIKEANQGKSEFYLNSVITA